MVATFESVRKDIASKTLKPVYLLKGEESYYLEALSEEFENSILDEAEKDFNLSVFYGKDAQIDDIITSAKQYPMMASHRVVILKEAQTMDKRELAKIKYHINTDAIKENLIPQEIDAYHRSLIYAEEADVLNVALFGMTAKEWREANPELKGNMRDYATINQLICLSNMENINAVFINEGIAQSERLQKLNQIAIQQMTVLENVENKKILTK